MLERIREALFFRTQHLHHVVVAERQLGIGVAHQSRQLRHQLVEERLHLAQLIAVPDCAPNDTSQDVTTAFVARNHTVDDQERAGTDMVGNDAQRRRSEVLGVGARSGGANEVPKKIDVVVAVDVLQDGRQTFEPHAGVDARFGQRRQRALVVAIELHEHQVPDLDVAIAVSIGRTGGAARDFRAVVIEDFAARATRTRVGHLPEIVGCVRRALVVANAHDAFARHADVVRPDRRTPRRPSGRR